MSSHDNQPRLWACSEFSQGELAEAAAGSLDESRAHELSIHLETCPICQAEMGQIVARLFGQPGGQIPGDEEKAEDIRAFLARSQIAPPPLADFQAGDRVDRYEVIRMLGKGGSATVYECVDHQMGRHVALKVLHHPSFFNLRQARYEREARVLARLDHPWIVKAFEIKPSHYLPYIVMELVRGGSSRVLIEHGPLESREAARLVAGVARAVQHAHDQNVLHRDLKPSNLLVVEPAASQKKAAGAIALKVSDFGLARPMQNNPGLTSTDNIIGTPAYMSPEQAGGKNADVGPGSDIYSLGVVLYEYMVGKPPLLAQNAVQTLRLVQEVEPVSPRHIQPGIPRDLDTICLKCLRKSPAERYTSAAALADDLERFLDGRPILARPIGPVHRLYRWARRKPGLAGAIGTSMVLLAALAAVSVQFAVVQKRLRSEAETNATLFQKAARRASNESDFARNLFMSGIRNSQIFLKELNRIGQVREIAPLAEKVQASNQEVMRQYATRLQMAGDLNGDSLESLFRDAIAFQELGYDSITNEILIQLISHAANLAPTDVDWARARSVAIKASTAIAVELRTKGQNKQALEHLQQFHKQFRLDFGRLDQPYEKLLILRAWLLTYIDALRDEGQSSQAEALIPHIGQLTAMMVELERAGNTGLPRNLGP